MDFEHVNDPATAALSPAETETTQGDKYEKLSSAVASDSNTRNIGGGDSTTLMDKELGAATDEKDEHTKELVNVDSGHNIMEVRTDEEPAIQIGLSPDRQNDPFQPLDHTRDNLFSSASIPEDKAFDSLMGLEGNVSLANPINADLHEDDPVHSTQNQEGTIGLDYPDQFNPVAPNLSADNVSTSPDRSLSPTMQHSLDSGVLESSNPKPETDDYFDEPTQKVDDPLFSDMPKPSPVPLIPISPSDTSEIVDKSVRETDSPAYSHSLHDEPSVDDHRVPTSLTHEPFTAPGTEPYSSALPKPETPIDLVPVPSAPSPHAADPVFQGHPPIESTAPGDHKPTVGLPTASSMEVEPPTPTLYRDTGEEHPHYAEDGLRSRAAAVGGGGGGRVQDMEEIPPAPDKPLPPTPGDEAAAPPPPSGCITVMEILLWRDPKKSGALFGTGMVVLISMLYFSFISVVAYLSLALLTVTLGFRLYKSIMGAVQKSSDGHPFQDLLSVDTTISTEKGHELADRLVSELNCCSGTLKDLFLVKDVFESVKFGFALYLLTYVGGCFNTMTLVIMAYVAAFTLPKVYEQNKAQIDQAFARVKDKVAEISSKVKAAIPMGKKAEAEPVTEEKKEE